MNKRPVPVVIIGALLTVIGVTGFVVHLNEMKPQHALALAWIAFHVAISFFDSAQRFATAESAIVPCHQATGKIRHGNRTG
jgi:hypothetical protein